MTTKSLKYLAVASLFAVSGCTYNQYTTTRGGYDDLYGGRYDDAPAVAGTRSSQPVDRNANPDYQGAYEDGEVVDQYYDENYITTRNIQRNTSNQVGYNAGFADGYYAGRSSGFLNSGFYGGMYPMWGYSGFNMGFRMGMGSMLSIGYSPFGWNRWNRWGSFYDPYWNSMAWGWGDPFMYSGFGYPYYGGMGFYGSPYGMYGYNPYMWSSYYPIIVNNHYGENGVRARNYGPRTSGSAVSRTASPVSRREPGVAPSARSARTSSTAGRGSGTASREGYYSRPRTASASSARVTSGSSTSRVSSPRSAASGSGNYYYANPNSNRSVGASANPSGRAAYRSSAGSRTVSPSAGYGTPSRGGNSYSVPSRGRSSSYSAPSRSYNAPSRSYSAPSSTPSRSYSAPSAPSRSYSAPSSGGGGRSSGGGGGGRGPR